MSHFPFPLTDALTTRQPHLDHQELLFDQTITTVRSTASVDQTLRVLAKHRILSAPVRAASVQGTFAGLRIDEDGSGAGADGGDGGADNNGVPESPVTPSGSLSGFIDIRDVLSSFLKELDMSQIQDAKMLRRMRILEEKGQEFACKSVESLRSLGSDGSFYNIDEAKTSNLNDIICDGFLNTDNKKDIGDVSRKRHVFHRLALVDGEGQLCHIVSQSDVIKFLYGHLDRFGGLGEETAEALGFVRGVEYVVKVSPETPAIDAMVLMEERDISAVAVVNADGEIIGNFSISELRNIMSEHFGSLALPVGEFLALEHGTEYAGYAATKDSDTITDNGNVVMGSSPKPSEFGFKFAQDREMRARKGKKEAGHEVGQRLITCEKGTTLKSVMDKIVRHRLHRVYVCTDDMIPVGVITLTDLLRKFTNHSCGWGGARSGAASPEKQGSGGV